MTLKLDDSSISGDIGYWNILTREYDREFDF